MTVLNLGWKCLEKIPSPQSPKCTAKSQLPFCFHWVRGIGCRMEWATQEMWQSLGWELNIIPVILSLITVSPPSRIRSQMSSLACPSLARHLPGPWVPLFCLHCTTLLQASSYFPSLNWSLYHFSFSLILTHTLIPLHISLPCLNTAWNSVLQCGGRWKEVKEGKITKNKAKKNFFPNIKKCWIYPLIPTYF